MRCCVIFYHKNILQLYPKEWVEQCVQSIYDQTYQDFEIIELSYGGGNERFTDGIFYNILCSNHIAAMNLLITHAFDIGFDVVFNTNADDYYHPERFEKQLEKIKQGYQLVSSNFHYVGAMEKQMNMAAFGDIGANLRRNHNVISHPCVAMHRSFWDDDLHYRNLLGYEDLDLWKRAYQKGKKFYILKDFLLYYRIHENQITKEYGINGKKDRQLISHSNR